MAHLVRINHDHESTFELEKDSTTFGRDKSCDIIIDKYENISREHCGFRRYEDKTYSVTDFGSFNGTFVNGERLFEEHKLKHGDTIKICDEIELRFEDTDSKEFEILQRLQEREDELKKQQDKDKKSPKNSPGRMIDELEQKLEKKDFKSLMNEIVSETKEAQQKKKNESKDDDDFENKYTDFQR
ncbi:MAG: FHA domain-containing protein [Lentisphaeria bacterium]|nr:FHA domain-containing protein [Lentisphaeria bacterium]NQZ66931.1 FHA domain-containing protein [Lentisphaeria bacterium]